MNTKTPECWSSDPNAHAVRVELSAEQSLLLPFDQFAFATHEVTLRGNSLRRIETAMQRMELSLLASMPNPHGPAMAENQPLIREIIVTDVKASEDRPDQPKPACTIPQKR
jgi:hypothetical protein